MYARTRICPTLRYTQRIDRPTHVINNSSCIDLIFTSNQNFICNSGAKLSLFDNGHHNLIFGELNFMIPEPPNYKRQMRNYKKANAEFIRRSIYSVEWNFLFQEAYVNQKVMILNKNLMSICHIFIPNNIINCSYKWPSSMTDDIKSKLRERSKMTKKYYKYGKMKSHLDKLQDKTDKCTALT